MLYRQKSGTHLLVDYHVHIGQFEDVYYEAEAVFGTVFASGTLRSVHFSSTSTCAADVKFSKVEKEIENALLYLRRENLGPNLPWLWFSPEYIKQGVDIEEAMRNIFYFGFKLHPYADNWDFKNKTHMDALHRIFDYTNNDGSMWIVIHTGESGRDSPGRFLPFFIEYPIAPVVLAHGRPASETIELMRRFPQIMCDTAFMPENAFRQIIAAGFSDRVLSGSDFPITHYFANHHEGKSISLAKQYKNDIDQMQKYKSIIEETKNALPAKI
jgi:predicted TIM-barrel fold metal-dependent hydrolase